jgi:chromosome segregation ATPase
MADGEAKPLSRGVMDKETKSFIESQTTDIIGVIRDMADMFGLKIDRVEGRLGMVEGRLGMVEGRLGGVETRLATLETDMAEVKSDILELKSDMSEVKVETGETKSMLISIEHGLQDKVEAQGDEIQDSRQKIRRIEKHLNLPHSLSA